MLMDIKHGNGKFSDLFLCLTFSLCFLKGCVAFLIGVGRELAILVKANSSKRSVSKHPYLLVDFIAPCVCSLLTFLNTYFFEILSLKFPYPAFTCSKAQMEATELCLRSV